MGSKPLRAVTIAVFLVLSTVCSRYPVARADVCQFTGWEWKKNSFGDSPCTVVSVLQAACRRVGSYPVRPLRGGNDTYYPPQNGTSEDLRCECDTVTYSLFMACSNCQGGEVYSWTEWAAGCSNVYVAQYPHGIPNGTAIPHWAFYDVTTLPNQTYNDTVAMAVGRDPEATYKPSPDSPGPSHKNKTAAIAGGVVGGVIFIILSLIAVFFFVKRRRQDGRDQPTHDQETSEDIQEKPSFTPGAYYDPNDPTTFPPPLNDIQNSPTHIASQDPYGQG